MFTTVPDSWTPKLRVRLVYVFKNWKFLFKNICGNTCGWKSGLKCVKYCLKTENDCLKTITKQSLRATGFLRVHVAYYWKLKTQIFKYINITGLNFEVELAELDNRGFCKQWTTGCKRRWNWISAQYKQRLCLPNIASY